MSIPPAKVIYEDREMKHVLRNVTPTTKRGPAEMPQGSQMVRVGHGEASSLTRTEL